MKSEQFSENASFNISELNPGIYLVHLVNGTKIITGRYFVLRMLPMLDAHLAKIKTGAEPVMALKAAAF